MTCQELKKQAKALFDDHNYKELDDLLTPEQLDDCNDGDLLFYKAYALDEIGKTEKAIKYYNKSIQGESDDDKSAYNNLGNIYKDQKEYEKAIQNYKKAIQIDPNFAYPYNGLGTVYCNQKKYEKAIQYYEKAIKINPDYLTPYNGLGTVYCNQKKYEKAIQYYEKAILINPDFAAPYYNLADLYYNNNKLERAKENYQKYLKLTNHSSSFVKNRLEEIKSLLQEKEVKSISDLIENIKRLLLYDGDCITHYTSTSVSTKLIFEKSSFRLSEGNFMNDSAEGTTLYKYLEIDEELINDKVFPFTYKPFIGSFVPSEKDNDLTAWRMYGKEAMIEATGTAITLEMKKFKDEIIQNLPNDHNANESNSKTIFKELNFYRIMYWVKENTFIIPGLEKEETAKITNNLSSIKQLAEKYLAIYKDSPDKLDKIKVLKDQLNEIAYLIKSAEYQYENEIRLTISLLDLTKYTPKVDNTLKRVYIKLAPVKSAITSITLGPKVERAEKLAARFYYSFLEHHEMIMKKVPDIQISTLPFK
ncbi:hypothetical protein NBRC110019_21290 [Neptunitalea chrysea]|uniref:UDP-N-acetylglucosamine--peptide N-acetylglucosaminyltransferase SPINDLY n=1 Tax=Neptunitalea chrysea TaxID=1647581 RepID=A0A9W6EUW5_9FLAO|nr:tetratricopeptide repeat protein [Neptunitalea chrysea]GLB53089.1 hypothetical protein NBRC110019_21290 [Neptunitalea chrysea]